MQKSAYKVKIGSTTFDSSTSPEIISISVDLDLDVPADSFKITLKQGTKTSNIKNGDSVTIELGYEDSLNRVLTGTVDSIEPKMSEMRIHGLSLNSILSSQKINQVYEKQSSGAIVKDLADRAGIAVKEAEEGISFPMYVVDDTKDVYTHMRELALKSGFDLFMNGEGGLVFKKYARQTPRPFKYGRDIIEAEVYEPTPIAACVKVYGESSASFKGADTAHWNTKKLVEGVAGSGDLTFLIEDPVIRDKDSAEKVATAFLERIMTPLSGTLKALGNSRVGLGDTIEIKEMLDSRMNGEFEATSISHIFNKAEGFTTTVSWMKKITISKAEAPLAAPPPRPAPPKPPSPIEEQLKSAKDQLEEKRMKLQDSVENAEMELESSQQDINKALSEQDKVSREMIAAAEDSRKTAKEAAGETLVKVDELRKELEAKKKEITDSLVEAKGKFEEYRKGAEAEIEKHAQEAAKLKNEAEKAVDERKKELEEKIKELENKKDEITKEIEDADMKQKVGAEEAKKRLSETEKEMNAQISEMQKTAENMEKEAEEKFAKASKNAEDAKKKAAEKLEDVNKSYNETRDKTLEAKKLAGLG